MSESDKINPPKTIYKYRGWDNEYHKRLITGSEIFMSSVRTLNDPFEYTLPISSTPPTREEIYTKIENIVRYDYPNLSEPKIKELTDEEFDTFIKGNPDPNTWSSNYNRSQKYLKDNFGVCSLSEDPTNFVMWSFYGDYHRGFCVGLDSERLIKFYETFDPYLIFLEKVNYTEDGLTFNHSDFVDVNYVKFLSTKSEDWSYEKEWRLISCSKRDGLVSRTTNIPLKLDDGIIKEVILGWDMSDDQQKEIQNILRGKNTEVSFYKIRKQEKSFLLYLDEIDD